MSAAPTKTVWVTREGECVKVSEMSDSHLLNTIRYLRRKAESQLVRSAYRLGIYLEDDPPDGAYWAAQAAEDELLNMEPDDVLREDCPTFPAMLAEAKKRGLQ